MDPVAMTKTALGALNDYKKQLDAAKMQLKKAKELMIVIEKLEVTLCMIPSRGDGAVVAAMKDPEGDNPPVASTKEASPNQVSIPQKSVAVDDDDNKAVDTNKKHPADVLKELKFTKGVKDLEVTFAGMQFIIDSALKIIGDAIETIKLIEAPTFLWLMMPWKMNEQNAHGEELDHHLVNIDKFIIQLQSVLSIASYAVSLEQLENALDATKMLKSISMREFWKKRIGVDKTRIESSVLMEAFFDSVSDKITKSKMERFHFKDTIARQRSPAHVALNRFLEAAWNPNLDAWSTVYEINNATSNYGNDDDVIDLVFQSLVSYEDTFLSMIKFEALVVDGGDDGVVGTCDDSLEATSDVLIKIAPFDRVHINGKLPLFNQDLFSFDSVCMMRFDADPRALLRSATEMASPLSAEYLLEVLEDTRAFVSKKTSKEAFGHDYYKWNAPDVFRDDEGKLLKGGALPGLSTAENYVTTALTDRSKEARMIDVGITDTIQFLYVPMLTTPGHYTARYCLETLRDVEPEDWGEAQKDHILAPKTYYFNRTVTAVGTPKEGQLPVRHEVIGVDNFRTYCSIALELVEAEIAFATQSLDGATVKSLNKKRTKIEEKLSLVVAVPFPTEKPTKKKQKKTKKVNLLNPLGSNVDPASLLKEAEAGCSFPPNIELPSDPVACIGSVISSITSIFNAMEKLEAVAGSMVPSTVCERAPLTETLQRIVDAIEKVLGVIETKGLDNIDSSSAQDKAKEYIAACRAMAWKPDVVEADLHRLLLEVTRFNVSFRMENLLDDVEDYCDDIYTKWASHWWSPARTTAELAEHKSELKNIENVLVQKSGLVSIYMDMVPKDIREAIKHGFEEVAAEESEAAAAESLGTPSPSVSASASAPASASSSTPDPSGVESAASAGVMSGLSCIPGLSSVEGIPGLSSVEGLAEAGLAKVAVAEAAVTSAQSAAQVGVAPGATTSTALARKDSSTGNNAEVDDISMAKRYLYSTEHSYSPIWEDASDDINIFRKYFRVQMALMEMDAQESYKMHNMARLKLLNTRKDALVKWHREQVTNHLTAAQPKKQRKTIEPIKFAPGKKGVGVAATVDPIINKALLDILKADREKLDVHGRRGLHEALVGLRAELETGIKAMIASAHDDKAFKRTEKYQKLADDLMFSIFRAKSPPPPTLGRSEPAKIIPLGLMIEVEDVNAMVWGEMLAEDEAEEEEKGTSGDAAVQKVHKYRPRMSQAFPFRAAKSIRVGRSEWKAYDEKDEMFPVAVFYNLKTMTLAMKKSTKPEDKQLTEIGVFAGHGEEGEELGELLQIQSISAKEKFKELLWDTSEMDEGGKYFHVRMLLPLSQNSSSAGGTGKTSTRRPSIHNTVVTDFRAPFPGGPELKIYFDDDDLQEHDDEDDDESEGDYDDEEFINEDDHDESDDDSESNDDSESESTVLLPSREGEEVLEHGNETSPMDDHTLLG